MRAVEVVRSAGLPATLGLALVLPLLLTGASSCGHDFDFHLQSWLAVRDSWRQGIPDPHWVVAANYGAGEPRFVFYPPLSWLLGALLGAALPWAWVPAAFTGICLAGAAASMHSLARRHCTPAGAALASALYAGSPYLLFTAYERTAYGELLAAVWMPLLLGALLLERLPFARVALLLAALWYTNAPAGVMGCYLVLLAFSWRAFALLRTRKRTRLLPTAAWRYGGALLLGSLLAADYLLPAWYEQRFVAIRRAIGPGMRVEDSFLFGHTGEPFHDQVLSTASWIAFATLVLGLLAGASLLRRKRQHTPEAPFLFLVLAVCLLLQLRLSALLWHALPELTFLQFPWRLLLPASAAAALLLALLFRNQRRQAIAVTVLFIGGMGAWAGVTRFQPCDDEDNTPAQIASLHTGAGFEGTDEYAPAGSDNGEIQQGLPLVRLLRSPDADEGDDSRSPNPAWAPGPGSQAPGTVKIERLNPEHIAVRLHPDGAAFTVIRLERFPAWRVKLDGQPCGTRCFPRDDGLVTVRLKPAAWNRVTADWQTPADVWWGRALTGLGFVLLLIQTRPRTHVMMRRK